MSKSALLQQVSLEQPVGRGVVHADFGRRVVGRDKLGSGVAARTVPDVTRNQNNENNEGGAHVAVVRISSSKSSSMNMK